MLITANTVVHEDEDPALVVKLLPKRIVVTGMSVIGKHRGKHHLRRILICETDVIDIAVHVSAKDLESHAKALAAHPTFVPVSLRADCRYEIEAIVVYSGGAKLKIYLCVVLRIQSSKQAELRVTMRERRLQVRDWQGNRFELMVAPRRLKILDNVSHAFNISS
tara:strand:- start:12270 stop:12761 length:492 start_codon:yes stop_codon:yes gene_type:complete